MNTSISFPRRGFLKGTAALVGAFKIPASVFGSATKRKLLDQEYDVIVVGSGAAGMTAALKAHHSGLKTIVLEKSQYFGGSTARSGGGIWIRNNIVNQKAGIQDSEEEALAYLAQVAGNGSSFEKQKAYIEKGPQMISFVMDHSPLRFRPMPGYADYYPEYYGGKAEGASIEPEVIDGGVLGSSLKELNPPYIPTPTGVVIYGGDYKWLTLVLVTLKGAATAAKTVSRWARTKLRMKKPLTMGQALAAGLRAGLLEAKVPVALNSGIKDLSMDEQGRVNGVFVDSPEGLRLVRAKKAVIMGSGGFEKNLEMRRKYQKAPIGVDWTLGTDGNTGEGIQMAYDLGANLKLMDDAWWGPTIPLEEGQPYFCLSERSLPRSIIVNNEGERFVNESAPYHDVVNEMYKQPTLDGELPIWMITDQKYRNSYLLRDLPPLQSIPQAWFDSGAVVKANSIEELALAVGLPAENLQATVTRFNGYAKDGVDLDFQRGESAYDRYYADPNYKPNPSLGPISQGPFYAFKVVPGDLGTKGGLETDERSRVLREDGSVIEGLYAAGNVSSPVMGRSYAGAGSTLGPAMAFGYIAAEDIAKKS